MKAIIFLLLIYFVSSVMRNTIIYYNEEESKEKCHECQVVKGGAFCKECESEKDCADYCSKFQRCDGSDYVTESKYCSCAHCH